MKKLIIQFLCLAMAVIAFSATEIYAQKRIKFDRNGKAKFSSMVKAKESVTYSLSGKDFEKATLGFTKCEGLGFELRRGNELLSSGHNSGNVTQFRSDDRSIYKITIINKRDKNIKCTGYVVRQVNQ